MNDTELIKHDENPYYYIDQLTGLANRFALLDYLKANTRVNLFLLNLDNFGNINNAYGFGIGDEILVEIANYLKVLKPKNAELFRFDGDEFAFIVKDFFNFRELKEFSESILSFFQNSDIQLSHDEIVAKISLSIGIAMGSGVLTLHHAKMAISELRQHSKGSYKIFNAKSDYSAKQQENIYWVNKIRDAINDEKLTAYFQPMLNNVTNKIEKFECLARIEDDNAMVSPTRFMEAAKTTGTLSLVTRTIISSACSMFSDNDYEFSINITGSDIHLGYLEKFLLTNVKKYNIKPSRIVLEILEDIVTLTEADMLDQIKSLRKIGFKVAIDDFGQENSNFSRLLELNLDYLKIDGAFIKNIVDDKQSQIIVEAIVDICRKSGIKTIAEYTHNEKVQNRIAEMGIDYSQGYYIGEPKENLNLS
ncbi:MAG: EAL domain-containing protein [Campylobacterota bacterium]|nr:EAL domain-containing protein [Campylobacterota bacterium]